MMSINFLCPPRPQIMWPSLVTFHTRRCISTRKTVALWCLRAAQMNHSVVVISSRGPTEAPEVGSGFRVKGGGGGVAWLLLLNNVQNKQKEHENNWLIQHLPRASCIVVWRLFYSSVSGQTICFIMSATLAQNSLLLEAAAKPTHHVSNQYAVRIRLLTQLFFLESSVRLNLLLFPVFPRRVSVKHDVDTMRHETSSGRIVDVWAVAYLHARYQSRNGMCHRVNNLRPVPR